MNDCLFCKILKGEIPSTKVYEDKSVFGFVEINPLAKEHYLFIAKNHSANFNELPEGDLIEIHKAVREFSQSNDLEKNGYRVVTNINDHGGQSVYHTHFHVLGGEQLKSFGA